MPSPGTGQLPESCPPPPQGVPRRGWGHQGEPRQQKGDEPRQFSLRGPWGGGESRGMKSGFRFPRSLGCALFGHQARVQLCRLVSAQPKYQLLVKAAAEAGLRPRASPHPCLSPFPRPALGWSKALPWGQLGAASSWPTLLPWAQGTCD